MRGRVEGGRAGCSGVRAPAAHPCCTAPCGPPAGVLTLAVSKQHCVAVVDAVELPGQGEDPGVEEGQVVVVPGGVGVKNGRDGVGGAQPTGSGVGVEAEGGRGGRQGQPSGLKTAGAAHSQRAHHWAGRQWAGSFPKKRRCTGGRGMHSVQGMVPAAPPAVHDVLLAHDLAGEEQREGGDVSHRVNVRVGGLRARVEGRAQGGEVGGVQFSGGRAGPQEGSTAGLSRTCGCRRPTQPCVCALPLPPSAATPSLPTRPPRTCSLPLTSMPPGGPCSSRQRQWRAVQRWGHATRGRCSVGGAPHVGDAA